MRRRWRRNRCSDARSRKVDATFRTRSRASEMQLDPVAQAAGVRHIALNSAGSTNAESLVRARAGDRGPLWITAQSQSAGRGRRGSTWVSPPGNLYATLLLAEPSGAEHAPQLSLVTALALHDAVAACAPQLGPMLKV